MFYWENSSPLWSLYGFLVLFRFFLSFSFRECHTYVHGKNIYKIEKKKKIGCCILEKLVTGAELEIPSFFLKFCDMNFGRERVKQRLVLYHGVMPIFMQFSDDAEEAFSRALSILVVSVFLIFFILFMLRSLLHVVKCLQIFHV